MNSKKIYSNVLLGIFLMVGVSLPAAANSVGTEGAAFLNIPVGAEPAAQGNAYSAQANNAYAATLNPGGLAVAPTQQLAAQHLSYLETMHYEYMGYVQPLKSGRAFGATVQYLGSGDVPATDETGNSIGSIKSHYGAYGLSYGFPVNSKLSLGVTGKIIEAKIDDVGAHAYAADFGSLYQYNEKIRLAAVLTNLGTGLKFLEQSDSLPLALHLGATMDINTQWSVSAEGVYRKTGLPSLHTGLEWRPVHELALRLGYRTDTTKGLSPLAGLTAGVGFKVLGQSFSYSWVPMGDLGNTQYFSVLINFK